jgi:hypothetical protein
MTGLFLAGRRRSKNPPRQIIYHLTVPQRRFLFRELFKPLNTCNLSRLPKELKVACLARIQTA